MVIGTGRFILGVCLSITVAMLELLCLPIQRKSGRLFHALARFWANSVLFECGVRVKVKGIEKLDGGKNYVYVSNHASMFDIPVVLASVPDQVRIIYKKELNWIPVFGWGLKWGSYIGINRGRGPEAMRSIEEAIDTIRNGASVLLFAEGTRTQDGQLQPFRRGAFNIAVRSGIPVVPVTINGTFPLLPKGSMVIRPRPVELILDDPISVTGSGKEAERNLMAKVHEAIERNYIVQNGGSEFAPTVPLSSH